MALNGRISNFSGIAHRYDATRHVPDGVLTRCYDLLQDRGALPIAGLVLDAGCGTGQMSLPIAARGLSIVGIDVADSMLALARAKVDASWQARYETGDVRAIAYPDGAFEGAVFSKLLMHVEDWQTACRELLRVTRPGACIVQIQDRGAFANAVRREFSRRADAAGFMNRFPGPPPASAEIPALMRSLGCAVSILTPDHLRWDAAITPRQALDGFRQRIFAEFWSLPAAAYDGILRDVAAWSLRQPGGLDAPELLRPFLQVEVYRKDGEPG